MAVREPFPTDLTEFKDDERISYDTVSGSYKLEDEKSEEWEWMPKPEKWVPVTDEALLEQQRQIYTVRDPEEEAKKESTPLKKRKASDGDEAAEKASEAKVKKQKAEKQAAEQRNKAIYVTSLPDDATEDELKDVFSKYGMIAESADSDKSRIKLYKDEEGNFKGDALIVYFRPESVQLAIDMLDETDFRLGQQVATGPMRVTEADASFKSQKDQPLASEEAKKKGTGANRDRQKVIKKNQEMSNRLADWDDDDSATLPDTSSRWDKVVVLKYMFTLKELAEEPEAYIEIKEDVREESEKIGTVTNVVLYDKEEDGVVTIRFSNAVAAEACVRVYDGRWFDGRRIEAYIADGSEKFKKSNKYEDDEKAEEERLEEFSKHIEKEEA